MIGGYCNKVCYVDLTSGDIRKKELDMGIAKDFIGDMGINLRLAYDLLKPGIDPFSPDNKIIIGAGPLVGTRIQAPRWTALAKLPLTGAIVCESGGMGFGVRLKRAGYDHVIISGSAKKPVYLKISDDAVEICDASDLWGKDIYETTEALWQKHGKNFSVTAIGLAGENLVKISLALIDKIGTIGKGGMAAVMGSKKLKAIMVSGSKPINIFDRNRFDNACDQILNVYKQSPVLKALVRDGKLSQGHDMPLETCKNATELYPAEERLKRYGPEAYLKVKYKRTGCMTCGYPCKDILMVREGKYKGLISNISSLVGRVSNLGIECGAGSLEGVAKLMDVCNRYGICSHAFWPMMALAVELYERGIITDKDTDGLVLKRGTETTIALLDSIASKKSIGAILGGGANSVFNHFGKECEQYTYSIKGLTEQWDPRPLKFNMPGFENVVNPEGGNIEPGHVGKPWHSGNKKYKLDDVRDYCKRMDMSEQATARIFDVQSGYNVPRITKTAEDFFSVITSLGICEYRTEFFDWSKLTELYSSATGIELTIEDMKKAGERIWNMFKVINVREGFSRKDDKFPKRWLQPIRMPDGQEAPLINCAGEKITEKVLEKMLDDYYDERGWDIKTGIPTKEKLVELKLGELVKDY